MEPRPLGHTHPEWSLFQAELGRDGREETSHGASAIEPLCSYQVLVDFLE